MEPIFWKQPNEICGDLSEMRQKTGFLCAISSRITLTKEKEGEKERARRKKGREEKNGLMVALLVFIMATLKIWPKKKLLDEKVHLAVTFSKIRLEMFKWNTVIAKRIFFYEYQIVTPCFSTSN